MSVEILSVGLEEETVERLADAIIARFMTPAVIEELRRRLVTESNPPSAETHRTRKPGLPGKEFKAPVCSGHSRPMRLVPEGVTPNGAPYPEHWTCAASRGDHCGDKRVAGNG